MNDTITYYQDSIKWVVKQTYCESIIALLNTGLPIDDVSNIVTKAALSTRVVKSNMVRSVKTIKTRTGITIYFKHSKSKGWRDSLKYTLFGSKAKHEWENARAIFKRGAPIGEPVAYGEKRTIGFVTDSFLMVREAAQCEPLLNLLQQNTLKQTLSFKETREIFKNLALFTASLHSNRILHNDLHIGNILLESRAAANSRPGRQNTRKFCLVDLHDVTLTRNISNAEMLENIAFLLYGLSYFCAKTELLKIAVTYVDATPSLADDDNAIRKINAMVIAKKREHTLSRSKRCLKRSSNFTILKWKHKIKGRAVRKCKAYTKRDYDKNALKQILELHNAANKNKHEHLLKNISKIKVTAFPFNNGANNLKLCVKEFRNRNFFRQSRETFFSARGKRAWRAANGFQARDILTPNPIALIEARSYRMLKQSFFITEYIENTTQACRYVKREGHLSPLNNGETSSNEIDLKKTTQPKISAPFHRKKQFIDSFAKSFRGLRKAGIFHADLKGGNILVKETANNTWDFLYIDLDDVTFKKTLSKNDIIRNLTQLNASLPNTFSFADRIRFYKYYFITRELSKNDKSMIKKIIKKSIKRNHFWKPVPVA